MYVCLSFAHISSAPRVFYSTWVVFAARGLVGFVWLVK